MKFNNYLFSSFLVLGIFIILSISVYSVEKQASKSTGGNGGTGDVLTNAEKSALQLFNKFHVTLLNQFMKFLSEY